jgi:predicted nucleotidyltransferase
MSDDEKFEKSEIDEDTFLSVLGESIRVMEDSGFPYVVFGGIASSVWGRPRETHDIDFFIQPQHADGTLQAFKGAGFDTLVKDPQWLYKAAKDKALVDIIFRSQGGIYLDDEMVARAVMKEYKSQAVKLIPAEDLLVQKAVVYEEEVAHQWFDAVAIVSQPQLDWDYLVRRAVHGTKRVLSLLIYAQSNDQFVPNEVVRKLYDMAYQT